MNALTEAPDRERTLLAAAIASMNQIVLGKDREIRLAVACLLARGHLLIEDIPGVGKTTLAHALARVLGLSYQRIQFTSDLLPADVIGISVYDRGSGRFMFHRGPVFAQLVMADEVNRATPKAQSALLEAMEERQVTVDGETHPLPEPFFVVATQNPSFQVGTFPLPESQIDRFLMRIELGYPAPVARDARCADATGATCWLNCRRYSIRRSSCRCNAAFRNCTRATRCWTTCRPWRALRVTAASTRPGCRHARSFPCCAPHRPGPSCTAIRACCRKTCRPCCRPSSVTACAPATQRTRAVRSRWRLRS
jgi:hypothetical protein